MRRKILGILGAILIACAAFTPIALGTPAMATEDPVPPAEGGGGGSATNDPCKPTFLGFRSWFQGLCQNGEVVPICEKDSGCPAGAVKLQHFVWRVVLNVLFDVTLAVGYISAAMVMYGGYMFMMSQGDPSRAAKGKKTLVSAITGLVISLGASVVVNTITVVLGIQRDKGWEQNTNGFNSMGDIFGWAYVAAGIVAMAFLIKSGIDYMTAAGDPGKTKKATHSIIYSVVGLIVVILASVITNFVISAIGGAMK